MKCKGEQVSAKCQQVQKSNHHSHQISQLFCSILPDKFITFFKKSNSVAAALYSVSKIRVSVHCECKEVHLTLFLSAVVMGLFNFMIGCCGLASGDKHQLFAANCASQNQLSCKVHPSGPKLTWYFTASTVKQNPQKLTSMP